MQVPGGWRMLEENETLLEKKKANVTIFVFDYILSEISISEWTFSLMSLLCPCLAVHIGLNYNSQ